MVLEMSPKPNYMSWEAVESFFEAHKVTRVVHSNSLFEVSDAHFVCEWVSKRKNHPQLTFVAIKKDSCVVRPPRLLCWIGLILEMSPKPTYMSWGVLEKFFEAHKVTRVLIPIHRPKGRLRPQKESLSEPLE